MFVEHIFYLQCLMFSRSIDFSFWDILYKSVNIEYPRLKLPTRFQRKLFLLPRSRAHRILLKYMKEKIFLSSSFIYNHWLIFITLFIRIFIRFITLVTCGKCCLIYIFLKYLNILLQYFLIYHWLHVDKIFNFEDITS